MRPDEPERLNRPLTSTVQAAPLQQCALHGAPCARASPASSSTRHLVAGRAVAGEEIGIGVDQVLLTDTNGTMAWLQFEAMGFPRVVPARAW